VTKRIVRLTVEELEQRVLFSAASNLFLSRVYQDLLQRPPDPVGMTAWGAMLDHGTGRETVVLGIQASREYHSHQIHDRYGQLLGRTPDPFGREAFLAFLDNGGTTDDLTARILSSPEYAQRHGGNAAGFLTAVYHDLLARTPDTLGMTAFTAALAAGASRDAVATAIVVSPECRQRTLAGWYQHFLHRPADAAGVRAWLGIWQQDGVAARVLAGLLGSPEYSPSGGGSGDAVTRCVVAASPGGSGGCGTPPIPECDGNCGGSSNPLREATGVYDHSLDAAVLSRSGIRYSDGAVNPTSCDLQSDGFGKRWGHSRSWTNAVPSNSFNGAGMVIPQLPYLLQGSGGATITAILGGTQERDFDLISGNYVPRFFVQDTLSSNAGAHEYVLTDTLGDQIRFYDFSGLTNQQGQFKSYTDADGNVLAVTSLTADGKPAEVQWSTTVGGSTYTESYLYSYLASGPNAGLLATVTLRRQVNGGAWTVVRQAAYAYYDGVQLYGNAGDLQTATIKDAAGNALDTKYYRYYTAADAGTIGYVHGLKYLFEPQSYARLVAAVGNPLTATDAQVAPYADDYLEYEPTTQRVTKAVVQGAGCSSCSSGQGTFTYSYTSSSNLNDYNSWATKTVESLPDSNQNYVYTNYAGEVMLKVFHDQSSGTNWETFYKYDTSGRVILKANPSAVSGYNDSFADLLDQTQVGDYGYLNATTGLIEVTDYYASTTAGETTAGGVAGYWQDTKLQQGKTGPLILQASTQYFAHNAGGLTVDPVATQTVYRNTDGTGAETTSYAYTWFTGTLQKQSMTVTKPVIASTQNGPGTADVDTIFYDAYGRPIWNKDADGFINYKAYDPATGAVNKTITDVDTTRTSDFQNLPTGWSTPSGGGLHLITQRQVEILGRPTKITDPVGNITYLVYNDPNYEQLVYPGWNSSTNLPTGPTQVYREDRPGSYLETLTMSATPHLTNGVPDGTEPISNLQTLARRYTNSAGQFVRADAYFNLTGVTYSTAKYIGTAGTNYYTTLYDYDVRGRPNRTQLATGTINRTVYDGLDRVISTWVGTNDMPASGYWSPINNTPPANMVQVTGYVYDGGGVGDSNLTQATQFPDNVTANQRVTQFFYDWRNRLMARKDGVQGTEDTTTHRPIFFYDLDNLGEITGTSHYDGDGVTITTSNGVPIKPAATLLREYSTTDFDDQQRVYGSHRFSVDQTNGTVSAASLNTSTWYNHRGQTIKISPPGGQVTKAAYDGAGRVVKTYTPDEVASPTWTEAGTVANNNVLSQTETQYDAAGNVIFTLRRDRFHNETTLGALGTPTTAPLARISYAASYYDAANRMTASVNVGTNGGAAYTRPSTVPNPSDTVLVTSTTYNAAGWVDTVTDPRGINRKAVYDSLGRQTRIIEAYTDGTPTNNTNRTSEYTYDGSGHVITLQADLPGGAYQQTKYIYGVTTATGSTVNSNDLLAAMQYPDKTTGNPSSSEQETYTVNALGERISKTDRNFTVHSYTYDVLGRQIADAVTTLGAGVNGAVLRIETAYDTDDRPYLYTSYNAASGGSIVNQVQQVYNGLSQLITEYQSNSGAVNTTTTPKVQYAYSQMASGANHSRLVSMTYPNGRVLNYNYGTAGQLNDTISRLDSLSDSSATLESYAYLGLDTVVKRTHPQPGIDLTYIKQTGEANGDAGDPYTGLDRFGRVVDQRWILTSTGVATDRFQYGYDRDNNRLYRNNLVNTAFGELYHASGAGYGYDNLNQLTGFARGVLSASVSGGVLDTIASPSHSQSWSLDALGNWSSFTSDSTTQTRTANQQNQITAISGLTTPTYDHNGNTTTDQSGKTLVYDAWNRLVQVNASGGGTLVSYAFDALNRRITENPGTLKALYYSSAWQVVEEQVGGAMQEQYVWSPLYVDAMIVRDTNSGSRLYAQQDANWNVTAVVDTTGAVQERYVYDCYGTVGFYDPNWNARMSSQFSWIYLHQGGRYDNASSLYQFRNREYSPTLGYWMQLDPEGYPAGDNNLYRYVNDAPTDKTDSMGLTVKGGIIGDIIYLGICKLICDEAYKDPKAPKNGGTIVCKGPIKCACVMDLKFKDILIKKGDCPEFDKCNEAHERQHLVEAECDPCMGLHFGKPKKNINITDVECKHRRESVQCYKDAMIKSDVACHNRIRAAYQFLQEWIDLNCKPEKKK
jgi:RHS repeat-associated protein